MTAPSAMKPSVTVVMNIAGVVQSPQESTFAPAAVRPCAAASASGSPVTRESRPTATTGCSFAQPLLRRKRTNAAPSARAAASVSTAGCPSRATASPRTSVPLFRESHSSCMS